jgi:ADP-ribose pyrophosphatase YjhB (NUDIX family)
MSPTTVEQIPCAAGIIRDNDDRLLLIRRATEPGRGLWSVPGGRCEPGESSAEACVREVREESGVDVVVERLAGRVVRPGREPDTEYVIDDYVCRVVGGVARAGDDADGIAWVAVEDLPSVPLTLGLFETLVAWGFVNHPDDDHRVGETA